MKRQDFSAMEPSITNIMFLFAGATAVSAGWHLGKWLMHVILHPREHFPH